MREKCYGFPDGKLGTDWEKQQPEERAQPGRKYSSDSKQPVVTKTWNRDPQDEKRESGQNQDRKYDKDRHVIIILSGLSRRLLLFLPSRGLRGLPRSFLLRNQ